jgi:hypothetical protein
MFGPRKVSGPMLRRGPTKINGRDIYDRSALPIGNDKTSQIVNVAVSPTHMINCRTMPDSIRFEQYQGDAVGTHTASEDTRRSFSHVLPSLLDNKGKISCQGTALGNSRETQGVPGPGSAGRRTALPFPSKVRRAQRVYTISTVATRHLRRGAKPTSSPVAKLTREGGTEGKGEEPRSRFVCWTGPPHCGPRARDSDKHLCRQAI